MALLDVIIGQIDAGRISPMRHEVVRALAGHLREPSELRTEILDYFDAAQVVGDQALAERLWRQIDQLPSEVQGQFRMLVALLQPDQPVGWELAEYLVGWALTAGVTDENILASFRAT